ncbi:MAG TPA: cytochrome b [Steroidobacteraceae bacterium]|nr:cytochrome b [Steroidobacteraceae bacterium]
MTPRDPMNVTTYTRTAVALHWLVAGFILAGLFMGWTMTDMAISPARLKMYNYHKWVGVTVLTLALLRLIWRLTHRPPPLVTMPRWQQLAAHGGHALLYLLMLVVPLTGWIYSNATGYRVVYLGKLPLPNLVAKDKALADFWHGAHELLATVLAITIALHVLAALQHHFLHKDNTLRRMFQWRR